MPTKTLPTKAAQSPQRSWGRLWRLPALFLAIGCLGAEAQPGFGVWANPSRDLTTLLDKARPKPSFVMVKAGSFSRLGAFKALPTMGVIHTLCARNEEVHIWVTHRLGSQTTMNRAAGQLLGASLNQILETTCVKSIELDIEPTIAPPSWYADFLGELRKLVKADRPLYLAIPAIGPPETRGYWWSEDVVAKALQYVDGVDVMAYDTGLSSPTQFGASLEAAVKMAERFAVKGTKTVRIGMPAYYDSNRPLHALGIENVATSTAQLRERGESKPALVKTMCHPRVQFLYYALWTMKPDDFAAADKFDRWLTEKCTALGVKK